MIVTNPFTRNFCETKKGPSDTAVPQNSGDRVLEVVTSTP